MNFIFVISENISQFWNIERTFIHPTFHLSVRSSVRPSVRPSLHPSVHMSICGLSIRPSALPSVHPSVFSSVCLFICLSVCLFICPSIRLFICPSVRLFICLYAHSFIRPSVHPFVPGLLTNTAVRIDANNKYCEMKILVAAIISRQRHTSMYIILFSVSRGDHCSSMRTVVNCNSRGRGVESRGRYSNT